MLVAAIVLCLLVGGSFADSTEDSYECRRIENRACDIPRDEFPLSQEEFDSLCSRGIRALRCVNDAADKCNAEEEELQWRGRVLNYVENELCNQDSHSYRIVSNNLHCIKATLPVASAGCIESKTMQEAKNAMRSTIRDSLLPDTDLQARKVQKCLHLLFMFSCASVNFERWCGKEVGEVLVDALVAVDPEFFTCPTEVRGQLPHVIDALRSAVEAEQEAQNAIKRRRK